MTFRQYLVTTTFATALAWIGWALTLSFVDPFTVGAAGAVVFMITLWLAFAGTFSLAGMLVRLRVQRDLLPTRIATASLRDACILATLLVLTLILRRAALLTWWNAALMTLLAILARYVAARSTAIARGLPPSFRS